MRKTVFTASMVTAFVMSAVLAPAANETYLTLKGQKSGVIKGSTTKAGLQNVFTVLAADLEVTSPRDAQSGLATGKRTYKPLVVDIPIDASAPQIYGVFSTNENLTEVDVIYRATNASGQDINALTLKLENANISSITLKAPREAAALGTNQTYLEISMTYQKITWTDGTISSSDMPAPGSWDTTTNINKT